MFLSFAKLSIYGENEYSCKKINITYQFQCHEGLNIDLK